MILQHKNGDEEARRRLIESNLRFVVKMALGFRNQGVPLADLIQEGNLGLIEALEKFDIEKECRLITYASWWIRLHMQRTIEQKGWQVNLPINKLELLRKVRNYERNFALSYGRMPTTDEVAKQMELEPEKIDELYEFTPSFHPIHSRDDDTPGLEKVLVDEDLTDPRDQIWQNEAHNRLRKAMSVLNKREREVLAHRFNLRNGGKKQSLRKVGQLMGLSAEGVRRIEAQAMSKLRRPHILSRMESLFVS
ncbi:MAG: sigma-70 family RNA polymerase sigma factor [bacterium]